jgi:hypothetical protein
MVIIGSPDITRLALQYILDLSGSEALITVKNTSEGAALNNVALAFKMFSPAGIALYEGDLNSPDMLGNGQQFILPATMPYFQTYLEWSGDPYRFVVEAKDSTGKIYTEEVPVNLCRPTGNQFAGKHYGQSSVDVAIDCNLAQAMIKDLTNYSYGGFSGKTLAQTIKVQFPPDEFGVRPPDQEFQKTFNVLVPLQYSGKGFQAVVSCVKEYEMSEQVIVKIRYAKVQSFDVNCNYDLCPVVSQFGKLLDRAAVSCDADLQDRISRINALLVKAVIAKQQPMCGFDLGKIIDEIVAIGEFDCSCTSQAGTGLNGSTLAAGSDLNIQFDTEGDIVAGVLVQGRNITLTLKDISYVFKISNEDTTGAFSVVPKLNGRTKTYELKVSWDKLTERVLEEFESNQQLLLRLKELTSSDFKFRVDGKCIMSTSASGNYQFDLSGVDFTDKFLSIDSITIDGVNYVLDSYIAGIYTLNTGIASLNQLHLGVFSGSYNADTGVLTIISNDNPRNISKLVIGSSNGLRQMNMTKSGISNEQEVDPNELVQAMIDYICALSTSKVKLGADKVFCFLGSDGTVQELVVKGSSSLEYMIDLLNQNNCMVINYMAGNGSNDGSAGLSCEAIHKIFKEEQAQIQATDFLLGTRNGLCGRWTAKDVLKSLISEVVNTNDSSLLAEWCEAVNICSGENVCSPVGLVKADMLALNTTDFGLVSNPANNLVDLVFSGFYANQTLPFAVDVTLLQYDAQGLPTITEHEITMPLGSSRIPNIMGIVGIPALPAGFSWRVNNIDYIDPSNKKFLHIEILNNGSATYKVGYARTNSGDAMTFINYPAQQGQKTILAIQTAYAQYDVAVRAICGPNNESVETTTKTPGCPDATIFVVQKLAGNFLINYQFPSQITKFQLKIDYPSNGGINKEYTVDPSGLLTIPIPGGIYGDYTFQVRSICDAAAGWYGNFGKVVILNVPQPQNTCPQVTKVVISEVTATTAKVSVWLPADGSNVAAYNLILKPLAGAPISNIKQPESNPLVFNLTGLTADFQYRVQVQTLCGDDSVSTPFDGGAFSTPAAGGGSVPFNAFWGWKDDNNPLTVAQIETIGANSRTASFANGAHVLADFTANGSPKFLWVAIPVSQSVKTKWYGSPSNYGNIGAYPNLFGGPVLVAGVTNYNFYITNYETQQQDTPLEFRNA